jgi:MFS family permease
MLGAAVGGLFSGSASDRWGRKKVIFVADICFTFGALMQAFSANIGMLMIGRLVIGLGVGIASMIVPVYASEVSPTEIRGKIVGFNSACITIGQLISSLTAYWLGERWRLMLGLAAIPSTIQLIGLFWIPESPRWLSKMK